MLDEGERVDRQIPMPVGRFGLKRQILYRFRLPMDTRLNG